MAHIIIWQVILSKFFNCLSSQVHVEKLDQRQRYLKIGVGNQNIHSSLKPASDFPTYKVDTNSGLCRLRQRSLESLCSCKVQHYTTCHSRAFLVMIASDSHSRFVGMDFFLPFPFPKFGNVFFSFPSRSRIEGMDFFHSLPVPELWEWIFFIPFPFPNFGNRFFSFLSHSQIQGMGSSIPFPFLNFGNGIIHSRSCSRTPKCHSLSPLF